MFPSRSHGAQQQPTPPLYPLHYPAPPPPDQSGSINADLFSASQFIPSYPQAAQDNLLESYRTIAPRNFARYQEPHRSPPFHDDRSTGHNIPGSHDDQVSDLNNLASRPVSLIGTHMRLEAIPSSGSIAQAMESDGQLSSTAQNHSPSQGHIDRERRSLASSHPDPEQMRSARLLADNGISQAQIPRHQQLTQDSNFNHALSTFLELERRQFSSGEPQGLDSAMPGTAQFVGHAQIPTCNSPSKSEQHMALARPGIFLDSHQTHLRNSQAQPIPDTSSHAISVHSHMPEDSARANRNPSETTTPAQLHGISVVDDSFDHTKESSTPSTAGPQKVEARTIREVTEPRPEPFTPTEKLELLVLISPLDATEYARHLYALASLILADSFESPLERGDALERYKNLLDDFDALASANTYTSTLHVIVECNFDVFIKIATSYKNVDIATRTIRFLTIAIMSLNYWEVYNLLLWKPAIYHFMNVINFDFEECYASFIRNYSKFQNVASETANILPDMLKTEQMKHEYDAPYSGGKRLTKKRSCRKKQKSSALEVVATAPIGKRKGTKDPDSERQQMIKRRMGIKRFKLSNYDPDVIHECQLPSPEEPHKLCLRRFSRKYELTRHQETVHSKKKKLYKCFVCLKESPGVGPRIFTRHDTLAKHIRVNHKMIGNVAKAQVAFSKKHAEIVDEGDITVHVGRRKTTVDFELRAHMIKRPGEDGENEYSETSDLESGDEEVVLLK